ncbi:proline dehydrogenase family protein [Tomitella cavernea]|uniref:L-glutamate gamma-semialdehyde dehydrogenase n=1 Tax=Tomitella cavernea TaxID=1387982 RepID=A0ABP9C5S0_9ACTN|nr:proline dehydrogenase family protein [Tomitella cavernea]
MTHADETIGLARRWAEEAARARPDPAAARLAAMLADTDGLRYAVRFIDEVIRPEDEATAAHAFAGLARRPPAFLPMRLRAATRLGGRLGPGMPRLAVPVVRRVLRAMVAHLVVDATDRRLGPEIARIRRSGFDLNLNLLGEEVLGAREADRRRAGIARLLARGDVDYVSVKVSAAVAPHAPWAFDEEVGTVVDRLTPLFLQAGRSPARKFINLDMEGYRDLDLTVAVFTRLLDDPRLSGLEAGIALQAYLPDSRDALARIHEWAARRRSAGGAPVKVRLVKGANLAMEKVEAELRGWPQAPWRTKLETDAHYKRLLDDALRPEHADAVRVGVAGHNLFDVAHAWLLAGERGVRGAVDVEMLLGMAPGQAQAVRRDIGRLLLYMPVVHPGEFDVAISYLVRRLEEGASPDNIMPSVGRLTDDAVFARERDRFLASLAAAADPVPHTRRTQDRESGRAPEAPAGFANAPDTDPAIAANRRWMRGILARVPTSDLGVRGVAEHTVSDSEALDALLEAGEGAGRAWGGRPAAERAALLRGAADALEAARARLIEVMAAEAGKTPAEADPEVSEAVDFARYYADRCDELDATPGARFHPVPLTVVAPPWNFPVAIPAGGALAALAAGSAVILKPAPQTPRCGEVLAAAVRDAGIPRDVLQVVHVDEDTLGPLLVTDPRVRRVILTGAYETAALLRKLRPDLPLLAETSGKNAIVVTPSADMDLAVRDVVHSAFSHAGQKCSAASIVILVGAAARSRRFRAQLVDAVQSLRVGPPEGPETQVGPLITPAGGKLLDALTTLDAGETWLVRPRRLDEEGRLWSPGVKEGVLPGSTAHRVEFFGPVLAVMTTPTLDAAVRIQNGVDYGLTAGLHSLDRGEIAQWLGSAQAGNLYVNRGITGAIVRRQPFGGWKSSTVGPGCKTGGPNYLQALGDWERAPGAGRWRAAGGDVSGLACERNVLRYLPVPVHVRLAEGAPERCLDRVLEAARRAGADVTVSAGRFETDAAWLDAVARRRPARIRLIGGDPQALARALDGDPAVAVHSRPVTGSDRLEMLPFLREQSVSMTAHRFGTLDAGTRGPGSPLPLV